MNPISRYKNCSTIISKDAIASQRQVLKVNILFWAGTTKKICNSTLRRGEVIEKVDYLVCD